MDFLRIKALYGLLAVISSVLLLSQFLAEDYLRGVDAYYYAVQADSWFSTGHLRIPDKSVIHYLIGMLQYLGLEAENAFRLWLALSLLLFDFAFLALLRPWQSGQKGFFIFLWALLSPSLVFCALEFPKTFAFMIVCTLWLYCLQDNKPRAPLFLLMPLAAAMHPMALIYGMAVLVWMALTSPRIRYLCRKVADDGFQALEKQYAAAGVGDKQEPPFARIRAFLLKKAAGLPHCSKTRLTLYAAMSFAVFVFFGGLCLAVWLRSQGRLPGTDLLLTPGLVALFSEVNLPVSIRGEFVAAAVVLLYFLHKRWRDRKLVLLTTLLVLPSCIPALGQESFSLGERFGLLFPYSVLLCLAYAQGNDNVKGTNAVEINFLGWATWRKSRSLKKQAKEKPVVSLLWLLAPPLVLLCLFFRLYAAHPERVNPDYERFATITDDLVRLDIPMLILHRGMHFYYKYSTGRDAFSFEPEKHWPKQKIWRLVYGVTPAELFSHMPRQCGWSETYVRLLSDPLYNLVREDCYFLFREAVRQEDNPELYSLLWKNPMNPFMVRPSFLYEKHKGGKESGDFSALP